MAWVAVDKNEEEWVYQKEPIKDIENWTQSVGFTDLCCLPSGSIEKLIGRKLTWSDEPVELKEE